MAKRHMNSRPLFYDKKREEELIQREKEKRINAEYRKTKFCNNIKAFFELLGRIFIALFGTLFASLLVTVIMSAVSNNISVSSAFMAVINKVLEWLR